MKKCVKVLCAAEQSQHVLENFIAQQAKKFVVEGIGQQVRSGEIQLYVCGQEEQVDEFLDSLYVGDAKTKFSDIRIETCPTDRSYRGVFRIVE